MKVKISYNRPGEVICLGTIEMSFSGVELPIGYVPKKLDDIDMLVHTEGGIPLAAIARVMREYENNGYVCDVVKLDTSVINVSQGSASNIVVT